ncbi:hypothetical protein EKI60_01245 [Candidatus Saccharibacteria bacterium]|nr:MAG: hypothetical protein EKI60_01245 [Candidatus Saccharibacteria bacterium]TXG76099.1 MAG: hypothetical protein E6P97_04310 [Patescibacteria group bacterium]
MAFKLFRKRPAARIKLGSTFLGTISATAEGYVIYKEWDSEDSCNYYWEEWELRGFNDYDSWIEYDHYTRKISLYEPMKPKEFVDPTNLKKGQEVSFTTQRGEHITATVVEVGVGTVARREGTLTYHVFEKDKVAYAECAGPKGRYCIEKYNDKELDIYKMQVLSRAQQKKLLGRVVAPGALGQWRSLNFGNKVTVAVVILMVPFMFIDYIIPQYERFCTPRTSVTGTTPRAVTSPSTSTSTTPSTALPSDEVTSQNDTQTCYRRRIYGGGGGGAGK